MANHRVVVSEPVAAEFTQRGVIFDSFGRRLGGVRAAVEDWKKMVSRMQDAIGGLDKHVSEHDERQREQDERADESGDSV